MNKLYLASQSPRRAQLLKDLNVPFEILRPSEGEDTESLEIPLKNELALDYVSRVTLAKLQAAILRIKKQAEISWRPILCADTTVCIPFNQDSHQQGDIILGKPRDDNQAWEMLTLLNNRWHWVHTAVAIQKELLSHPVIKISSTKVFFANNSPKRLRAYIATQEPHGKAGAYGIQGLGSVLIEKIEGSYSGVMGLPIFETTQLLDYAEIPFILSV